MSLDLINKFVRGYRRELEFYAKLATIAEERCRRALGENGIPASITSRSKRPDRLLDKLRKRNTEKNYKSLNEIHNDIFDLSGVRIALYFPSQEAQVASILQRVFTINTIKRLDHSTIHANAEGFLEPGCQDYRSQFPGYRATHLRVEIGEGSMLDDQRRYGTSLVEIQVASLLMFAWSEIHHDLSYKNFSGSLSNDERRMIDGLNGLVRTGEVMLSQLKASMDSRISVQKRPFANYFELGAFLQRYAPYDSHSGKYRMGSLSWLLHVTKHLLIDNAHDLGSVLDDWSSDPANVTRYPIARSILDFIFAAHNQSKIDPLSAPFLTQSLNEKFRHRSAGEKLAILRRILSYACDESAFDCKGASMTVSFPLCHRNLYEKGYLKLEDAPIVPEVEVQRTFEMAKELWEWFANNDSAQVRVALGVGRARAGSKF